MHHSKFGCSTSEMGQSRRSWPRSRVPHVRCTTNTDRKFKALASVAMCQRNAASRAIPSELSDGTFISTPMRRIGSRRCARAASGHGRRAAEQRDELAASHGSPPTGRGRHPTTSWERPLYCASQQIWVLDVRDGSFASWPARAVHSRTSAAPPKADVNSAPWPRSRCAISGHAPFRPVAR